MDNSRRSDSPFDLELEELEKEYGLKLEDYDVECPSEEEMMRTIEAIRPYVPVKENRWRSFAENSSTLLKNSYQEIFYFSRLFWLLNVLFLVLGTLAVFAAEQDPYVTMLLLAPLPTITGLFEIMKSKLTGMAELELSFKYSLLEIILSRMLIIGGFNVLINLIATVALSILAQDVWAGKLLLYWMIPFTVVTAISLLIANRLRHMHTVTASLVVWLGAGVVLSNSEVIEKIESVPAGVYVMFIIAASILIIFQAGRLYKRGMNYEFNH
ncbi:hypothetical protein FZC84_01100 [Rossellomorea vietnamensis]|uniref:Uncharacterized protein n=1 Tax=Rossellomorea vietnamensis TaxID=218284 RepID=A0A5D4MHB8_9BACI|nr:hypothetical protein [Rossellomorea vietnamensis]TYS01285.1 hypothetical protein FZC84_01100 [Rossellomorea vietnamensis]